MNWKLTLKVLISVALLVFIFNATGIQSTFQQLSSANLWYVPIGVTVYLLGQVVSSYRWQKVSEPLGFKMPLIQYFDFYMMGMYFSLFLPGAIGGDVGKMFYLAKTTGKQKRSALLTILAERGFGFMALVILIALMTLTPVFDPLPEAFKWGFRGLFLVGLIVLLLLKRQWFLTQLEKQKALTFFKEASVYWKNNALISKSVLISILYHMMLTLIHMLIVKAFGLDLSPWYLIVVYTSVSLVSILPISFNGFGVREGAYQYFLMQAGVESQTALAFALYFTLISTLTSLLGGLVMLKGHYKTPEKQDIATIEA